MVLEKLQIFSTLSSQEHPTFLPLHLQTWKQTKQYDNR